MYAEENGGIYKVILQSHLRGDFGLVLFNQNVFKFPIAVSWYFELKATNG